MTLGWIKEDVEERFYEAIADRPVKPSPPPTYDCPYCQQRLADFRALNAHLQDQHTSPRPFLLLNGREPGGEDTVRNPFGPHDLNLVGTASVDLSVDHGPRRRVGAATLVELLGACGSRSVDIRLANDAVWGPSAQESYRLKVRIASEAELRKADETFVRLFGREEAHLLALDRLRDEAGSGPVDDYVGALCNYVHGVLMKDFAPGTGVHAPRVDWAPSYKASLQVLAQIPRPLPVLLSGLMRFALNDFSAWRSATNFPLLDHAFKVLGPVTEGDTPSGPQRPRRERRGASVCPVDAGVYRVMDENYRLAGLKRWSAIDECAARDLASSEPLGALDRAKAQAIWALSALRLGAPGAAVEPLRRLSNNDCFGAWAEAQLADIAP